MNDLIKLTKKMIKQILIALLFILVISCKTPYKPNKQNHLKTTYNKDSTTVKFKGIITNIKYDCRVDAVCSIEVNNKWWIAIIYGRRDPSRIPKEHGLITGIQFFPEDKNIIGKKVAVYAKIRAENKLTVEGDNNYYVKVIE